MIIEAGRDYVLAIKDNQPDLHEAVVTAFADATAESADATTCEKNAGSVETRRIWCDTQTAEYASRGVEVSRAARGCTRGSADAFEGRGGDGSNEVLRHQLGPVGLCRGGGCCA